jgi:integrase
MRYKLDARTVAGLELPPGKTEELFWDTEVTGYALRLRRTGEGRLRRTWIAQYRANGRARRVTIGSFDKLTAPQAREAARKILARVELGHDPQAEKAAKRVQAARAFRSAVEAYLEAKRSELRPASYKVKKLYLAGSYFRSLHPVDVAAVTRANVAACIRAVASKHSAGTAAAARRHLSAFFAWAVAEGLLGNNANPVDGSHRPEDFRPRDHALSDPEVAAIWKACGDDEFGTIIRLLILLGSRRQEVGGMCWSEIDLEVGTWALPAARAKNKHSHTIRLPPTALETIRSIPVTTRDQLFGARAGQGFTGWYSAKLELDRRLEAALNHYSGHRSGVAGVYNRSTYERAVTAALARWDEYVIALVEGRKAKVVALRRQNA